MATNENQIISNGLSEYIYDGQSDKSGLHRHHILWIGLSVFLVILTIPTFWVWLNYVFPKTVDSVYCNSSKTLLLLVSFPNFISNGDVGEITITAINEDPSNEISDEVIVSFQNPPQIRIDPSDSSVFDLKELKPGERRSKKLKFELNEKPEIISPLISPIIFSLHTSSEPQTYCDSKQWKINVAKPYMLGSTVIPVFGKFVLGAFFIAMVTLSWKKITGFLLGGNSSE